MNSNIKDWVDILTKLLASIGGLIAAFRAIYEIRANRKQRIEEFRWKQANISKTIIDELLSDEKAQAALTMLDWPGRKFLLEDSEDKQKLVTVSRKDITKALRTKNDYGFDDKEVYIRDCFDSLFNYFERIQHFIDIKLIDFQDVVFPVDYYVFRIMYDQPYIIFKCYFRKYGYRKTEVFFEQLPAYKNNIGANEKKFSEAEFQDNCDTDFSDKNYRVRLS